MFTLSILLESGCPEQTGFPSLYFTKPDYVSSPQTALTNEWEELEDKDDFILDCIYIVLGINEV